MSSEEGDLRKVIIPAVLIGWSSSLFLLTAMFSFRPSWLGILLPSLRTSALPAQEAELQQIAVTDAREEQTSEVQRSVDRAPRQRDQLGGVDDNGLGSTQLAKRTLVDDGEAAPAIMGAMLDPGLDPTPDREDSSLAAGAQRRPAADTSVERVAPHGKDHELALSERHLTGSAPGSGRSTANQPQVGVQHQAPGDAHSREGKATIGESQASLLSPNLEPSSGEDSGNESEDAAELTDLHISLAPAVNRLPTIHLESAEAGVDFKESSATGTESAAGSLRDKLNKLDSFSRDQIQPINEIEEVAAQASSTTLKQAPKKTKKSSVQAGSSKTSARSTSSKGAPAAFQTRGAKTAAKPGAAKSSSSKERNSSTKEKKKKGEKKPKDEKQKARRDLDS